MLPAYTEVSSWTCKAIVMRVDVDEDALLLIIVGEKAQIL
jgi:hypothetical protein